MTQQLTWQRPRAGEWLALTTGAAYRIRPSAGDAAVPMPYVLEYGRLDGLMVELGGFHTVTQAQAAAGIRHEAILSGDWDRERDTYQQRVRELQEERAALAAGPVMLGSSWSEQWGKGTPPAEPAEARQPLVDSRVHDVYTEALTLANLPEPTVNGHEGYTLTRQCGGRVVIMAPTTDAVVLFVYSSGGAHLWNAAFTHAPASVVAELLVRMVQS